MVLPDGGRGRGRRREMSPKGGAWRACEGEWGWEGRWEVGSSVGAGACWWARGDGRAYERGWQEGKGMGGAMVDGSDGRCWRLQARGRERGGGTRTGDHPVLG